MLFNKVISRGENFPIPRGMPLRFDANGKKSPRNRFFVLLHPITQKALCATFTHNKTNIDICDWSNAAHEPTHALI
jgi:hypothetical protein